MGYEKQLFSPGQVLTAAHMNHIEDGLENHEWQINEFIDFMNEINKSGGGVGIKSIEQTETAYGSGGINIITVTLTDGTVRDFEIRNGQSGQKGKDGVDGLTPEIEVVENYTSNTGKSGVLIKVTQPWWGIDETGADVVLTNIYEVPIYHGSDGQNAKIAIVNVESLDAGSTPSATVSNTPAGAIITLKIPKGDKGDPGTAGKTAYQYAQDGGYAGTEAEFSAKLAKEYPTRVSELTNDSNYITAAGAPVQSVNGQKGVVALGASDVKARPVTWTPTYSDVGADRAGTASSAVSTHNTNSAAHNDIRLLITALSGRMDALANSDDENLDQMAEVVAYIKDNRVLIEQITTGKVSVEDIIDNLTTNVPNKPLSAAQGVALKALVDAIVVPTKLSQLTNDKGFITGYTETDPTVPAWAKADSKPSYTKSEVGLGNVDNVKQYSASNPPPYPVTSVNGKTGAVTVDVPTVPTKVSAFTNDAGYITGYTESDPTVPAWAKATNKPSYTASEVGAVPTSRKVNGKALSSDITLAASDVSAVPTTRKVNGKALSSDVSLSAADVGAVPNTQTITVTGIDADGVSHSWTMYGVAQ